MKLLSYIFAFAYILTNAPLNAKTEGESRIVAIVNDKSILTSDLNHRFKLVSRRLPPEATKDMIASLRQSLLQQMIDEVLQRQLMEKYQIKIEGPELDSAWGMMEQRMGFEKGGMEAFLKANGIPKRLIDDQLHASIGWQTYVNERYGKGIEITDAELRAEQDRLEKNKQKNQALLSEIVLTYDSPEKAEEAKRKADELSAKLRQGAQFPLMAQQYSHSASAARGGDIGWVSLDDMAPEMKKAVTETRRGDISAPVPVKGGYRIVAVRDRHGVGSVGEPVEYVSFQQIEFQFPMFGGQQAAEETMLRAQSIRQQGKSCSMMKKLTDGRPRIKLRAVDHAQAEMMHPELVKVLRSLKSGDRSELMNTGQGLIMFQMCDRNVVKPHEPDEKEIKAMLREKKLNSVYERELRALRRTAFIDVKS